MDPRVALDYWLDDSDKSYECGREYNEAVARGFVPAFIVTNAGNLAIVRKVSGSIAKVIYPDGHKSSVHRRDINRVSLY